MYKVNRVKIKTRLQCSRSHARPCRMVLASRMLTAGFRWITRTGSKATGRTGTARWTSMFFCSALRYPQDCNSLQILCSLLLIYIHDDFTGV